MAQPHLLADQIVHVEPSAIGSHAQHAGAVPHCPDRAGHVRAVPLRRAAQLSPTQPGPWQPAALAASQHAPARHNARPAHPSPSPSLALIPAPKHACGTQASRARLSFTPAAQPGLESAPVLDTRSPAGPPTCASASQSQQYALLSGEQPLMLAAARSGCRLFTPESMMQNST